MEFTSRHLGKRIPAGLGLALLLCLMVMAGCTPKRVIRQHPEVPAGDRQAPGDRAPAEGQEDPIDQAPRQERPIQPPDPAHQLTVGLKAATLAQQQLNKPYQWGAEGPDKFDCSGLAYYVYGSLGVSLPRVSRDQARAGRSVERADLQPGDLVFFILNSSRIDHVGIYVGDARFIHAPRRYSPVRYDSLNDSYWRRKFQFGRRVQG